MPGVLPQPGLPTPGRAIGCEGCALPANPRPPPIEPRAHTATATEPAPAAHASATTAATPGFGAVDSSSRKHECNRNRGCADMSEREH